MKSISITQLKKMTAKQLVRLVSRHEVQITRYGKPAAIMTPLGPYFSASRLRDIERQWKKCDQKERDSNATDLIRELRAAQKKKSSRRMGKPKKAGTPKKKP
jgi:antitoxin (DNA-binding transcriptional repressor) of toxin-antitoxin stability system